MTGLSGVVLFVMGLLMWWSTFHFISESIVLVGMWLMLYAKFVMKKCINAEVLYEHMKKPLKKPYNPESRSWGCEE
jgi:hypothetical protein